MNTPTLTQSEEQIAPWNEKTKTIWVDISVSMSNHCQVEIPIDADETDNLVLEKAVLDQICLPQEQIGISLSRNWIVDEFCVV